ncbi:MAG TPA: M14 family zinc carboxypeptidase [Kofleriaceae bacterium]|nr:M14 family zinc carboxypeptidase [Kofleriaceae bacterium]
MRIALVAVALLACTRGAGPKPALVSTGERSNYLRTGRYDEAVKLCHDFARAYRDVRCDEIGRTGQDRPVLALRIAKRDKLPTIFIQAGIHAGEIEGKDAGFAFLRDLLDGKVAPGALDVVSVVFVPVVNPDGHERFGPNHRINQRGPEEMGFRTNGARLNLNRDYVKLDAPELRAVVETIHRTDPVVFIDLHTTDGAKFEHDIAVLTAPYAPRGDQLDETAAALSKSLQTRLAALGHLPLPFYPSFIEDENPMSGFAQGEAPPRFSQYYVAARSRLGILVETHSWRSYKERATSTYHTLQAVFEEATRSAQTWRAVCDAATTADRALAGRDVTLLWTNTKSSRELAFRGYAFEKKRSEISNGTWIVYDENTPQIWNVPYFDEVAPAVTVKAPRAGYIVDGGFAAALRPMLDAHGITYRAVAEKRTAVEVFRPTAVKPVAGTSEGRTRVELTGQWTSETRTLDRGAIYIPVSQPTARLILHMFEPVLPDSLAQWGQFNAVFERKEYMEPYVAEQVARDMLAKDPSLRAAFDAAVAADPEMAKSPGKRLEFFYRRHPAWDDRVDLLPVYRVDVVPE